MSRTTTGPAYALNFSTPMFNYFFLPKPGGMDNFKSPKIVRSSQSIQSTSTDSMDTVMFIENNQLNFDYTKRIHHPVNRLNWILILHHDATHNSATERRYDPAQCLP